MSAARSPAGPQEGAGAEHADGGRDVTSSDGGAATGEGGGSSDGGARRRRAPERHSVLLRLDPAVHAAIARWAADDLRSVNAQIDWILRRALTDAGRAPSGAAPPVRRGRPLRKDASAD